jgi:hypothetical protein
MEFEVLGKRRGFRLGTYTFKLINQMTGTKTVEEVFEKFKENNQEFALAFYFCCAKHYCLSKKQEVDFDEVEVADWLDEIGFDQLRSMTTELFKTYVSKNQPAPATGQAVQLSNGTLLQSSN